MIAVKLPVKRTHSMTAESFVWSSLNKDSYKYGLMRILDIFHEKNSAE